MREITVAVPSETPEWARARRCARVLREAGHDAWVVGGAVRDHLLGLAVHDVDLCTDAAPERVCALFDRALTVGSRFGVVVVVDPEDGGHTEVASYRSDRAYVDGRRPSGIDLADQTSDVQRRDFTINALLLDPVAMRVRDHVGGLEDLHQRRLRCIGDPVARLHEDRLRVLRGIRFLAHLDLSPTTATEQALRSTDLVGVSCERLLQEWCKGLDHPAGWRWIERLRDMPQLAALDLTADQLHGYDAEAWSAGADVLVRSVAVLLPMQADDSQAWFEGVLPWSRADRRCATWLRQAVERIRSEHEQDRIQRLADMHAPETDRLVQLLGMLERAGLLASEQIASWRREYDRQRRRGRPDLPDGRSLLAVGVPPGPALGRAIEQLRAAWLTGQVADRAEALELARRQHRSGD